MGRGGDLGDAADFVEALNQSFELGWKAGGAHEAAASAHHQQVIEDNQAREAALDRETQDFFDDLPDPGDF
jgi:hypothetical protein